MGWFEDALSTIVAPVKRLVKDPSIGNILDISIGSNPFGGTVNLLRGGAPVFGSTPGVPQVDYTGRRGALQRRIVDDQEIDDFTREELLKELAGAKDTSLSAIEEGFVKKRSSQDPLYVTRRNISFEQKQRKDQPGLRAQTVLTGTTKSTDKGPLNSTVLTSGGVYR